MGHQIKESTTGMKGQSSVHQHQNRGCTGGQPGSTRSLWRRRTDSPDHKQTSNMGAIIEVGSDDRSSNRWPATSATINMHVLTTIDTGTNTKVMIRNRTGRYDGR